jgi:lipopolysaccharide transport system ATP-binding protein
MQAITRLCGRAYWLHDGRLAAEGPSEQVVARYLREAAGTGAEMVFEPHEAPGSRIVRLLSARVVDTNGETAQSVDVRQRIGIEMRFDVLGEAGPLFPKVKLANDRGEVVFNAFDTDARWRTSPEPGTYTCTAWIPPNLLNEGVIAVDVTIASLGAPTLVNQLNVPSLISFHVTDPGLGDTAKGLFTGQLRGGVRPLLDWTTEYVEARAYETA